MLSLEMRLMPISNLHCRLAKRGLLALGQYLTFYALSFSLSLSLSLSLSFSFYLVYGSPYISADFNHFFSLSEGEEEEEDNEY